MISEIAMLDEQLLHHAARFNTFHTWPLRPFFNVWELAYCGFYFHAIGRTSDLLRCVFCGMLKKNWTVGDSPWLIHAIHSPECVNFLAKKGLDYLYSVYNENPYLLRPQISRGLPLVISVSGGVLCDGLYGLVERGLRNTHIPYLYYLNDGTKFHQPRNPGYTNYHDRLETFQGQDYFGGVGSVQALAQSGQIYHGPGTLTSCYYCGEEFMWNNGIVEPWEKHARKRTNCFHVHFSKGEVFLEKTLKGVPETQGPIVPYF